MKLHFKYPIIALVLLGIFTACANIPTASFFQPQDSIKDPETQSELPLAEVEFEVQVPPQTLSGVQVYIQLLDEFTEKQDAQIIHKMETGGQNIFSQKLTFAVGSIIKYRYLIGNDIKPEINFIGIPVAFRLYYVNRNEKVQDIVSSFGDTQYEGANGIINGIISDLDSNNPIPNILISAGGLITFSASDGSFVLDGLPPGIHNLVAYTMNGEFLPFQQGALVASGSITQTDIQLKRSNMVEVTFNVKAPKTEFTNLPIRMAGNLYQLGNTFSSISAGKNIFPARTPFLKILDDGSYTISIFLPSGYDLRYKYTVGGGVLNGELDGSGGSVTRQLVVPEMNFLVTDTISSFSPPSSEPVVFMVQVPDSTPVSNTISIQFKIDNWENPIPMWSLGNNQWMYILYNPVENIGSATYRYCRNDQCGLADDIATMGKNPPGLPIANRLSSSGTLDIVSSWAFLNNNIEQTEVVGYPVISYGSGFMAGVELDSHYSPSWQPYLDNSFRNIEELGANWVFLSPTWSYKDSSIPIFDTTPGVDPLWDDMLQMMVMAQEKNLNVAIYPLANFSVPSEIWWQSAKRDSGWWQKWFDRYRVFILHHADMATRGGASGLVLGDPNISPFLTNIQFPDGSFSSPPENSRAMIKALIQEVRLRFNGTLIWVLEYPAGIQSNNSPLEDVDQIYFSFSPPLNITSPQTDLSAEIGRVLDETVYPFSTTVKKPIIIGIRYPSSEGGLNGCVPSYRECWLNEIHNLPNLPTNSYVINTQVQNDIYSALLFAINQRKWITGVVSEGYFPPVDLVDPGSSIHGKPAAATLWYWYPRMTAQQ